VRRPSAEQQVQFLIQIQRLLDEGSFVASYKFALLLALAQVAIEHGDDSGAPLRVTTRQLAEQFVRLYWRQALPYVPAGRLGASAVLKQNTGRQAAVLRELAATRARYDGSLAAFARDTRKWGALVSKVARTIEIMPLWRLQVVGREALCFLYERGPTAGEIELKPGIAFCFRRFQPLVQDLVQGAWVRFVRRIPENRQLVGEANELGEFLFGSDRASLAAFQPILREAQHGRCFYCHHPLRSRSEVDHFIPWSRYAMDFAHNFVLADTECNARKKDRLASFDHLERWCERNVEQGTELAERFDGKSLFHDLPASLKITHWAYAQAEDTGAQVWERKEDLVGLDPGWKRLPGLAHPR
jgi:5-methylcytosine-specific restriction endonuclease McrA